jgi:oligopeptide/dipeptide ABC transporter ATP-binding protein
MKRDYIEGFVMKTPSFCLCVFRYLGNLRILRPVPDNLMKWGLISLMSYSSVVAPAAGSPLIRVRQLQVRYAAGQQPALAGVDFDIRPGEIVGVLGESGSGKSTLALSILGLLPPDTHVHGSILFQEKSQQPDHSEPAQGRDLLQFDESSWHAIRGATISMIFQEPGLSLSPVMRVGDQIAEVLRAHGHKGKGLKTKVTAILRKVQLADTDRIYAAYPHQLSGGQLHRIAIAQALACRPALVIADEPTRSLDVTVQAEILNVLREANRDAGSALLFITHHPALLAGFADRIIVMYAGHIVEEGPADQVLRRPLHPYTKALLQLVPSLSKSVSRSGHLPVIPGSLSSADHLSRGCIFEPRCPARTAGCQNDSPEPVAAEPNHHVSCFNYGH